MCTFSLFPTCFRKATRKSGLFVFSVSYPIDPEQLVFLIQCIFNKGDKSALSTAGFAFRLSESNVGGCEINFRRQSVVLLLTDSAPAHGYWYARLAKHHRVSAPTHNVSAAAVAHKKKQREMAARYEVAPTCDLLLYIAQTPKFPKSPLCRKAVSFTNRKKKNHDQTCFRRTSS